MNSCEAFGHSSHPAHANRTLHTARTHCAHCTHALCTLHAARTHCAHCTHALCTLHARTVHTARTHCAHCAHSVCTLHARIVQAARTHCAAARTHCAHCTPRYRRVMEPPFIPALATLMWQGLCNHSRWTGGMSPTMGTTFWRRNSLRLMRKMMVPIYAKFAERWGIMYSGGFGLRKSLRMGWDGGVVWRASIDVGVSYSVKVRMKLYGRRADVETFRMMKDHRNGQYRCVFGDFFLPRHHCLTASRFA